MTTDLDALLTPLNLPDAIRNQARRLLIAIQQADSGADLQRAADRADGFGLGIETVRALNPSSLEGLYMAFDRVADERRESLPP
ncbi:hypothetical protein V4842_26430 [Pseudomonas moraviensis]